MELHQLLRLIPDTVPLIICDIQGVQICKVYSKNKIDVDLYEYKILMLDVRVIDFYTQKSGLYIILEK